MMKTTPPFQPLSSARRRGNVLVLVVVVLGLLALLGGAYLQTARVQRQMYFDAEDCSLLARGFVIEEIKTKLKDDIFDPETGSFLDFTRRTEPYDRAWTNENGTYDVFGLNGADIGDALGNNLDDTWLASPLPFLDGTTWRWRQISTLSGTWFDTDGATDPSERRVRADASGAAGAPTSNPDEWYGRGVVSLRDGVDYNIAAFGDDSLVDADGDGMPDSRLSRIDSFATKNGVEYFAAVRVIDLASFLNVNTAATGLDASGNFDTTSPYTDAPRGLNPAELNLGLVAANITDPTAGSPQSPADIFAEVKNAIEWRGADDETFSEREGLWRGAGRRLKNLNNPTPPSAPDFNIYEDLDELELRYRGGAFDYTDKVTQIDTEDPDGIGVGAAGPGMTRLWNQGVFTAGVDEIDDDVSATAFFPYTPGGPTPAPGTRIRFTTASAEALFATPLPIEFGKTTTPDRDVLAKRILKTSLTDDRFDVIYRYPGADLGASPLQITLGGDDALGPGSDSVAAAGSVPARPSSRIQASAEALTELAFLVKKVYNSAFTTNKALDTNPPFVGDDPAPVPTPAGGTSQTPILMGLQPGGSEARVNAFAAQFAANFKDYVDEDNVITVLDVDGMPLPDRGTDRVRMFPRDNTWTDTASLPAGESAVPVNVAPSGDTERYGFELLPYISEVYVQADYTVTSAVTPSANDNAALTPEFDVAWSRPAGEDVGYAIEIRNPFEKTISLSNIHLYVAATPATVGTPLTAVSNNEWTTSNTTLAIPAADQDADRDGDDLPGAGPAVHDHDLADLLTHYLRDAGVLTATERKDTLRPNEVLILYRNAGPAALADNDQIVATGRFSVLPGTADDGQGPGIREPGSQQWDGTVTAGSMPDDSAIDDRSGGSYTYVEMPFDWPTSAGGVTLSAGYPQETVTLELYAAVADDGNGFASGVTGGANAASPTNIPDRFARLRYQVVDTAREVVDAFATTMYDMPGAPTTGTRVTMQHSTVGNANGINSILMRRTDFEERHVYPNEFDVAHTAGPGDDVNDPLQDLVGDGGGVALIVTRKDVYDEFSADPVGVQRQQLVGELDKTGAPGFPSPGVNGNKVTPGTDQVIHRDGPIEYEAEIASLLLLGTEPTNLASPALTGSTADSFFNSTLNLAVPAAASTLDHFRLNFGVSTSGLTLPVANRELNSGSPAWEKAHARVLLERLTALSPATDGIDNDGDGATDEDDEQVVAGRLNLNSAEFELMRDVLPFAAPGIRTDIATALLNERGDNTLTQPPVAGVYSPWDVMYRTALPVMPNAAADDPGDSEDDGQSRIDFVQNTEAGGTDGISDDVEERFLFGGGSQQVLTTRSDVYVAYILVQGYRDANGDGSFTGDVEDGLIEQSRSIVIFDRSKLITAGDNVEARVLYEFPK